MANKIRISPEQTKLYLSTSTSPDDLNRKKENLEIYQNSIESGLICRKNDIKWSPPRNPIFKRIKSNRADTPLKITRTIIPISVEKKIKKPKYSCFRCLFEYLMKKLKREKT